MVLFYNTQCLYLDNYNTKNNESKIFDWDSFTIDNRFDNFLRR